MTVDYLECCLILLYLVAGLSLILSVPNAGALLCLSESLPAQRDGKFTVGLTQILLTGISAFKQ